MSGEAVVAILLYTPRVVVAPLARSVPETVDISGVLEPDAWLTKIFGSFPYVRIHHEERLHDLRITVTGPRNRMYPPVSLETSGAFRSTITCGSEPGERWISIEATADTDPEQLALFPIYCRTAPPATFSIEPTANLAGVVAPVDLQPRARDRSAGVAAHRPTRSGRCASVR
jgi:hypothetical protein